MRGYTPFSPLPLTLNDRLQMGHVHWLDDVVDKARLAALAHIVLHAVAAERDALMP